MDEDFDFDAELQDFNSTASGLTRISGVPPRFSLPLMDLDRPRIYLSPELSQVKSPLAGSDNQSELDELRAVVEEHVFSPHRSHSSYRSQWLRNAPSQNYISNWIKVMLIWWF